MTDTVLPPPRGPRGLALRAVLEGLAAGKADQPVSACPYSSGRGFTRRAWLAGYTRGRAVAGLPLPASEPAADE